MKNLLLIGIPPRAKTSAQLAAMPVSNAEDFSFSGGFLEDNDMKDFERFLNQSDTFVGFEFNGSYSMDKELLFIIYEYYKLTGINLLDDYSNMVYLEWNNNDYVDLVAIEKYENSQSKLRHSRLFDYDWMVDCRDRIKKIKYNNIKVRNKINNEQRYIASKETSRKATRELVFKMHGKKCVSCGGMDNIQIDHVVPVSKNGLNDISNYQPLCKSCNCKKGDKIIDYR